MANDERVFLARVNRRIREDALRRKRAALWRSVRLIVTACVRLLPARPTVRCRHGH